jgi:DNA-directed RNA polymerase subunit RPC12/RpoP
MAHAKTKWQNLTHYRCGKCGDRLSEPELDSNQRAEKEGTAMRCFWCMAQAGGGNDPETQNKEE